MFAAAPDALQIATRCKPIHLSLRCVWLSVAVDEHNVPTDAKRQDCADAVAATFTMLRAGVTARDIMTKKAFQNAVTVQASVPLASPCVQTHVTE